MHGRVKVKTPAEQEEARKAERLKKIQWYSQAVDGIFTKRDADELDADLMARTEDLLRVNPDFSTVWNTRRSTLLRLIANDRVLASTSESSATNGSSTASTTTTSNGQESSEASATSSSSTDDCHDPADSSDASATPRIPTRDERLVDELTLTMVCLKVNPKSYGVWHHRGWVMGQMDEPNWNREVELCSRALALDSRNFHCWDYRRFVAQRSTRSAADEVAFTSEKIRASYSNYSAWHNRGRLLPSIFPGDAGCGISKEKLGEELDFAKNAMYTDPVDQSAFFYHRWLLGREESQLAVRCLFVDRRLQQLIAVVNKPMNLLNGSACIIIDEEYELASWQTPNPRNPSSTVLVCQLAEDQLSSSGSHVLAVQVSFKTESALHVVHLDSGMASACHLDVPSTYNMFKSLAASPDVLQQELDSLLELIEINDEADSKWAFLTAVQLLQTLDPVAHREQVQSCFDSLLRIDSMRSGYYRDLRSRYSIQSVAQQTWRDQNPEHLWQGSRCLDLSRKSLHGLFHLDNWPWLLRLDVSGNNLTSLSGCQVLHFLQELVADDNGIEEIEYELTNMMSLTHLSLKNNAIRRIGDALKHLTGLRHLALVGNPIASEDCTAAIFSVASNLENLVLF